MRISETIHALMVIQQKFGDLEIVGGYLNDDSGLRSVSVVNNNGMEIYPHDPNGVGQSDIEGVFLE